MQPADQVRIAVSFGPELLKWEHFPRQIGPLACLDGLSINGTNPRREILPCVIKVVDEKLRKHCCQ